MEEILKPQYPFNLMLCQILCHCQDPTMVENEGNVTFITQNKNNYTYQYQLSSLYLVCILFVQSRADCQVYADLFSAIVCF